MSKQKDSSSEPRKIPAETGNASNPSPYNAESEGSGEKQILNEKAEKYLREASSIEDEPDAQDQEEMDETLNKEK